MSGHFYGSGCHTVITIAADPTDRPNLFCEDGDHLTTADGRQFVKEAVEYETRRGRIRHGFVWTEVAE